MKKILLVAVAVLSLVACNNKKTSPSESPASDSLAIITDAPVYELDSLLNVADQLVDKTVKVDGYVTHTCKHSGKRCFIVGDSQKASMRVEAKGNIGGFNRELVGSKLQIVGVIKERRLTQEYIDQSEKEVNERKLEKEDGSAESCQAELNNIAEMKAWMKANNKDYYAIYYMDGQDYEVLDK